jgi:hypothetical protein
MRQPHAIRREGKSDREDRRGRQREIGRRQERILGGACELTGRDAGRQTDQCSVLHQSTAQGILRPYSTVASPKSEGGGHDR